MNRLVASAWFGVAAVFAVQSAPVVAARSRGFSSTDGYALRYPAGWTRVEASPARLLILSRGSRVQGPVIGPGQAAILVRTLDRGEPIPATAIRSKSHMVASGACRSWRVLEISKASDPGPVEISRSLYCVGDAETVLVQLTYWAGDPRQAAYRRIATDVAASVRFRLVTDSRHSTARDR
jgi:hypothetical protein